METVALRGGGDGPDAAGPAGRGVLDGAFALLDVLGELGEAGLTRLSEAANVPKATAYRLLEQLTALGAVEKTGGRYRVGPRIFSLARMWRPDPALMRAAHDPMLRLARTTGASVGLGVLAHGRIVLAGVIPGEVARRAPMEAGLPMPRTTAVAATLLAWAGDAPSAAGRPLPGGTAPLSAAHAEHIRGRGAAFDRESVVPEVNCAAVPVIPTGAGAPVAALCAVAAPSRSLPALAAALTRAGTVIAASLP